MIRTMIIITLSFLPYIHCFLLVPVHRYSPPQKQPQQQHRRQGIFDHLASPPPTNSITSVYLTKPSKIASPTNTIVATKSTTTGSVTPSFADTWEDWCRTQLQLRYNEALQIKCPFFRRRASDILDAFDMILQFIIVRHKSLSLLPLTDDPITSHHRRLLRHSAPTVRCSDDVTKLYHLPIEEILTILIEDWKVTNHKGYYVTGKLSTNIYQDDTYFDGPDPDMPVRGLYKYINAASQLFDTKHTYCELLSIELLQSPEEQHQPSPELLCNYSNVNPTTKPLIVAKWKMQGRLRLPWKPIVPEWTGTTYYYIHPNTGLIYRHIETWDISVFQAFVQTLFPTSMTQHMFHRNNNNNDRLTERTHYPS